MKKLFLVCVFVCTVVMSQALSLFPGLYYFCRTGDGDVSLELVYDVSGCLVAARVHFGVPGGAFYGRFWVLGANQPPPENEVPGILTKEEVAKSILAAGEPGRNEFPVFDPALGWNDFVYIFKEGTGSE